MKNKNLIYLAVLIVIVVLIIILNKLDIIRINFNVPNTINTSTSMPLDNENINSLKGTTSSFSDLSKCKKEVIDNNEFNVFEGWSDNFSSYTQEGVSKFNIYNIKISDDNYNAEISANFSKVYIMENGAERKLNMDEFDWYGEDLWNFKVYYKVVSLDDSLSNSCPGWEEDLTNSFVYKIVMQKPIIERQTITANQWQCAGNDFISLWHDGTWIFANDITLNEGCNIKFANRSDYSYITKCDFLDPVLVNSIKVEGNLAHSKFNGTSFLYADNIYFDTKLSIDKDTNISMSNFVYNSKDFAEDMQSFDLINYNMNNYWKTRKKTVVNKYYLQPYIDNCYGRCTFYWCGNLLIDISDNISDNTSLAYLINHVEQKQVDYSVKNGVIDQAISLDFKAKGTLYCGRLVNFMSNNQYACVLKPDTVTVSKVSN